MVTQSMVIRRSGRRYYIILLLLCALENERLILETPRVRGIESLTSPNKVYTVRKTFLRQRYLTMLLTMTGGIVSFVV